MARIHSKIEIPRRDFGDILQMIYCILESGATCHMTPDISDFFWDHWWKQISTLKLQIIILSQRNKHGKSK